MISDTRIGLLFFGLLMMAIIDKASLFVLNCSIWLLLLNNFLMMRIYQSHLQLLRPYILKRNLSLPWVIRHAIEWQSKIYNWSWL